MDETSQVPATTGGQPSRVSVTAEVISSLASLAALDVEGVLDLAGGNRLAELLGLKRLTRGVRVKVGGETPADEVVDLQLGSAPQKPVELDIGLVVDAAAVLPEVAAQVQTHVTQRLEKTLKIKPASVNVLIVHVRSGEAQPQEG